MPQRYYASSAGRNDGAGTRRRREDVRRDENETGCFDVLGPCLVALEVSGRLGVSAGSVAMDVSTFSRISI